jgi:hypothetical protein
LPGPTSAAWREEALTRAQELDALAVWIRTASSEKGNPADEFGERITKHLEAARSTAAGEDRHSWKERLKWWTRLRSSWGGSSIERSTTNLDAVEAHLLRLAPADYVRGEMPSVAAYVCRYLKKDDPRRTRIEQLAQEAEARELLTAEREAVVAAYHAASSQRHRELMRLRSFRNVLVVASAVLLLVVIGLGVLGSLRPQAIPLCFEPETQDGVSLVCPTGEERIRRGDDIDEKIADTVSGWDVWLVEIVGLIAAAVATAFALRGIRGTSTPYSLPVALAILEAADRCVDGSGWTGPDAWGIRARSQRARFLGPDPVLGGGVRLRTAARDALRRPAGACRARGCRRPGSRRRPPNQRRADAVGALQTGLTDEDVRLVRAIKAGRHELRARFTLAHELGRVLLPWHLARTVVSPCSSASSARGGLSRNG